MIDVLWIEGLALLSVLSLLKLNYQDLFKNRDVDERDVQFFIGAITLLIVTHLPVIGLKWAVFGTFLAILFGSAVTVTFKLGSVDGQLITAMASLFFMNDGWLGLGFMGILLLATLLYLLYCKLTWKPLPQPYLPVITTAWIITMVITWIQYH